MTDLPMDQTEHPDEGTIHAWLDDALDGPASAQVAMHLADCPACATAVAEARGLIAGASRVVRALDSDADATGAPAWGAPVGPTAESSSLWRLLRVTPARAAIAASLIVVAGIALTRDWVAKESYLPATAGRTQAVAVAPPHDSLLDSAIARNVRQAVPPRAIEAAPGASVPASAPAPMTATVTDRTAPQRVAEGRFEMAKAKAAPPVAADRVAAGEAIGNVATAPTATAQRRPDDAMADRRVAAMSSPAAAPGAPVVAQCLRIESPVAGARWGTTPLPVILTLEPTTGTIGEVKVRGENGRTDSSFATWKRQSSDSILILLRRIGFTGSMQIASAGEERGGTLRSGPAQTALSEVVVTGVEGSTAGGSAKGAARRARPAQAEPVAPAGPAAVEIRAREVSCR
jgi:hypothetical protein